MRGGLVALSVVAPVAWLTVVPAAGALDHGETVHRRAPGAETPLARDTTPEPAPDTASVPETDTIPPVADTLPPAADTLPPSSDTVPAGARDTLRAGADTLPEDSLRLDVGERREELAGGEFPSRDSVFQRLLDLPGFHIIEYRGEEVELQVPERVIRLREAAQVNYGPDALTADTVVYQGDARFLRARGQIELLGPRGEAVTSDSTLLYDVSGRRGTILDARTRFSARGTSWFVRGDAVPVGQDTLYADPGSFTSCELEQPHYSFTAGQVKLVNERVIVAWPVVMYVGRVPVAWLPFFAQDIRPDRRSGILPPRFGFNDVVKTSDNFSRQINDFGYYWAISEFMDAEATVDWFSGNHVALNGRFRYDFMKKFIDGSALVRRSWGNNQKSLRVEWDHTQELAPDTRLDISAEFLQNRQTFQDRSFDDPTDQTQTIDSDVAFSHKLDFASLDASARRRQFLGDGKETFTFPSLSLNFSPVTLFPAPRNRAGLFDNITWNGSLRVNRTTDQEPGRTDTERRSMQASSSFRVGDLSLSSSGNLRQNIRTPEDSLGNDLSDEQETRLDWNSSASYRVELMGNTSFRPRAQLSSFLFRSDSTAGDFVSGPLRLDVGANLTTDLFGFLPGFGPFQQIRHRISPRVDWRYSPAARLSERAKEIPDFPARSGRARNRLTVSLQQTFEAKLKPRASERPPARGRRAPPRTGERRLPSDTVPGGPEPAAPDTAGGGADAAGAASDTVPAAPDTTAAEDAAARGDTVAAGGESVQADTTEAGARGDGRDRRGRGRERREARKLTLLSVNTSPLEFDFERRKENLPVLATEQITANVNSDLLRGLGLNMSFDLFEGTGEDRDFDPFLTRVGTSFSFRSGTSLGDIIGLGATGAGRQFAGSGRRRRRPARGGQPFSRELSDSFRDVQGGGPWSVSLRYSLFRGRPSEGGQEERQTLNGTLRLEPTPNWSIWWDTQYSISDGEFGQHSLRLERDLHHWWLVFRFVQMPSGNLLFDVMLQLRDAPELKIPYDIRTQG